MTLAIGDRVRLRLRASHETGGEWRVIAVGRVVRVKARYRVGQRVTVVGGICLQATGRIVRRAPRPARWVVRFDEPQGRRRLKEAWFDENELAPWTVPESARPVSVGALKAGGR